MSKQGVTKLGDPKISRPRMKPKSEHHALPSTQPESQKQTAKGMIISRSADLGDGYFLVQIKDITHFRPKAKAPKVDLLPQEFQRVPEVSREQVVRILARIQHPSETKLISETPGIAAPASKGAMPNENKEFLDQFAKKELEHRSKLEKKGELVDSGVLADRMSLTRQAINKAVADMRMFSLDGESGKKLYPAFFADDNIDRRKLQAVSKALGHLAGSSKWQFFTNPRLSLGKKTPVEALRKGKYDEVLAAATAFLEA